MPSKRKDLTEKQVLEMAKRMGYLNVNPLTYRKSRIKTACFSLAKQGLLRKERINAGSFNFYPVDKT